MKGLRWTVIVALLLLVGVLFTNACGNSSVVKIGVIVPREGSSLADYGYQLESGINLALSDVEASHQLGEIKKKYILEVRNEPDDIEKVKETFKELVDKEGVVAIIGAASSAATLALAPMANDSKIVLLSPASSSPEINQGNSDYIFRNHPSDTLEAQKLANVIFQKCVIRKCLMVRAKNAYSEGITFELLRFARQIQNDKLPNEVVKFDTDPNKVDWAAVVDRVVEIDPEGVFLGSYADGLIPLIKELRSRQELKNLYIFTSSSFLPDQAINVLGKEMVEGVMFTGYAWDPMENRANIQEFSKRFKEQHLAEPTIYAATGYDAMWILVKAIDGINHHIPDNLRASMNNMNFENLLLGETDFNKRGDVTRIPMIYRITDGRKVELTAEDMEQIKSDVLTRI